MSECLMICRSLTYAQRTVRAIERVGVSAMLVRLPQELRDGSGCGYCVRIRSTHLRQALNAIRAENLPAVQVFCRSGGGEFAEVRP